MQVNIVVCSKIVSLVMLEQLALSMFCVADSRKPFPLELSRHSQPVNVHATAPTALVDYFLAHRPAIGSLDCCRQFDTLYIVF